MKKNDVSPASNPLFSFDGHLTDTAFKLLMEEKLDPLQSLEVSEHLSFCDRCLERYTDILSGVPLLTEETDVPATVRLIEPPASLHTGIMQAIRDKTRVIYLHKFGSLAVAASLALVFWSGGLFTSTHLPSMGGLVDGVRSSSQTILEQTTELSDNIGDFFRSLQNDLLRWKYHNASPHND